MILSKASIDLGRGSGGGGGCSGTLPGEPKEVTAAAAEPLVPIEGPSTELAMSSSRDVAASNLLKQTYQLGFDILYFVVDHWIHAGCAARN